MKNTNAQVLLVFGFRFFAIAPDMSLMSSHVLKQLDCMKIFYFYLVCFTFSISYSELPFHLTYFPIPPSLLFFYFEVLSQAFIKHSRKAFEHIYVNNM